MGYRKKMKDSIGGTSHGDIKGHGVQEGLTCRYRPRKYTIIAVTVIFVSVLNNLMSGFTEKFGTVHMRSDDCSVSGK